MGTAPAGPGVRGHTPLNKPIAVTAGEPAGVGPELCLALAESRWKDDIVIIGDARTLRHRAERLGVRYPEDLRVVQIDFPAPDVCATPSTANAKALLASLDRAVEGCMQDEFSAMVTAPLQKSIINEAGIAFTGHTEYLAALCGTPIPVMMLVAGDLRVALASTHLPLREVADYLSEDRIRRVLEILHCDLQRVFGIDDPRIIVCGLNPHAGEGGHLGWEDEKIIAPVVLDLAASGLRVRGPVPADTAFTPGGGERDAILAMYHDQGLPVLKYAGFGHAVNVTLGLPIIRTSVDHGTALNIAGTGQADPGSLFAAVELAADLAAR